MNPKSFYLVLLYTFCLINLDAQDQLLRHFTTKEGLPSSTIYRILQDEDGFIWFGTDAGVTRFDGRKFENYTMADGLSDNNILAVNKDSKGRIWFLGYNGTASYWLKGKIYNATSDPILKQLTLKNSLVDLFEDKENRLWFITMSEYIILDHDKIIRPSQNMHAKTGFVINGNSGQIIISRYPPLIRNPDSLNIRKTNLRYKPKLVSGHLHYASESVFFISDEGVIWQKDTVQKILIPFHHEFLNSFMPGIAISNDSLLWITIIGSGLYCYDLKRTQKQPKIYLDKKATTEVLADRDGNIWIGTRNDGLYMIPEWERKVKFLNKESGLPNDPCYAIHKQYNGEILMALDQGKIYRMSKSKASLLEIPEYNSESNMVQRIISQNDDVWIATDNGLIHQNFKTGCNHLVKIKNRNEFGMEDGKTINVKNVKDITFGNKKIYIATSTSLGEYPSKCNLNSGFLAVRSNEFGFRFYSVYCDGKGEIWYGTISGLKSKKDSIIFNYYLENDLLTKQIKCIAETEDHTLILATYGFGVLFYKNGKIINRLTVTDGLCNNICRRVFVYKDRIYVCTPSGVSVIKYSNEKAEVIQNLNESNFLPSNDVFDIFVDDIDILVATFQGAVIITHQEFEKLKPSVPLLYITRIEVNDSLISPIEKTVFPFDENSLKISFIGLNYLQPLGVIYRYRLNENKPWQITENNQLEFSFLEPGEYFFQLQAHMQNGNWSAMRGFVFSIATPFWRTFWFLGLLILVIGSTVYLLLNHRIRTIKKFHEDQAKMSKQITDLEQQALQTMMNPHFIFNVMNSIQSFINANNKDAANRYLANFAKLIRMNLNISYKRFITLDEEITYLNLYLSFEKLRFGEKLTYEIMVDPLIDTNETNIAVMMIQPFLENAIWHGISALKEKGHILLKIDKKTDELISVSIEDNGVGINIKYITDDFRLQTHQSHALNLIMERLSLLEKSFGQKLFVSFKHKDEHLKNKGTIAELILPSTFNEME